MKQTECQYTLPFHPDRKLTVDFEGGRVTSDAGLMLLYAVDRSHGLSRSFASCLKDERDSRYVRHAIGTLTAQRMLQIAAGYEDGNDADSLRSDAALKSFCDRLPETGDLIGAVLRAGNRGAAVRAVSVLRRIVKILRRWVGEKLEIETLRRRVFKLGARIRETTRRIWIHCSSAYPEQETFFLVLRRICGPPGSPHSPSDNPIRLSLGRSVSKIRR